MNKVYALVFSIVMIASGNCMAAELVDKQKQLKESLVAAVYVAVALEQEIETTPHFDQQDLENALKQYLAEVDAFIEQGVTLSEQDINEAYAFGDTLEHECQQLKVN